MKRYFWVRCHCQLLYQDQQNMRNLSHGYHREQRELFQLILSFLGVVGYDLVSENKTKYSGFFPLAWIFIKILFRVGNDIAANIPYFLISIPFITPFLNPFARRQSFVTVHHIRKRKCLQISWTLEKGIKYIMNIRKGFKISSLTNFSENLLPNGLFYLASSL